VSPKAVFVGLVCLALLFRGKVRLPPPTFHTIAAAATSGLNQPHSPHTDIHSPARVLLHVSHTDHCSSRSSFALAARVLLAPSRSTHHPCVVVGRTHTLSRSLAVQVKLAVTIALGYLVCVQIFQMLFDEEDPTAPIAAGQEGEREAVARVQAVLPMASEEDIRAELSECHSRCS
jgi:hypothetical protein